MVKLKGPLNSATADGSLGGTLIFSHIHRTNYLKRHARPKTSNTLEQISTRAINEFLIHEWTPRTAAEKATWLELADPARLTNYNAYLKFNIPRWHEHLAPSTSYPPPAGTSVGSTGGWAAVAQGRRVKFSLQLATPLNNWGATIYQKPTAGATPYAFHLIHVIPMYVTGWHYWTSRPYDPGTYYFTYGRFTKNGWRTSVFGSTLTVTIT